MPVPKVEPQHDTTQQPDLPKCHGLLLLQQELHINSLGPKSCRAGDIVRAKDLDDDDCHEGIGVSTESYDDGAASVAVDESPADFFLSEADVARPLTCVDSAVLHVLVHVEELNSNEGGTDIHTGADIIKANTPEGIDQKGSDSGVAAVQETGIPRTSCVSATTEADDSCKSGALGPTIIYLTDDDEDEVEAKPGPFLHVTCLEDCKISYTEENCAPSCNSNHKSGYPYEEIGLTSSTAVAPEPVRDKPRWSATTIGTFTVQCNSCGKWRIIPSKEQYQAIGEQILEHPWVCEEARAWREDVSCRDPSDISEDEPSILWAVDKHSIPKPPSGFHRKVVLRGELSRNFADVYYKTPCGQTLRSMADVERFLREQPCYTAAGIALSQFNFSRPRPGPGIQKRSRSSVKNQKTKKPCFPTAPVSFPINHLPLAFPQPLAMVDPTSTLSQMQPSETCPTLPKLEEPHSIFSTSPIATGNGHSMYPAMPTGPGMLFPFGAPWSPWLIYEHNMSALYHQIGDRPMPPQLPFPPLQSPVLPIGRGQENIFPAIMPPDSKKR